MIQNIRSRRGDTIIEVLLALTIFTAAIMGVMYVMSNSIGVSQRSLEITQTRTQIDNQIELLRHIHNIALVSSGRSNSGLYIAARPRMAGDSNILKTWKSITAADNLIPPNRLPAFNSVDSVQKCTPETVFSSSSGRGLSISNGDVASRAFFIDPVTGEIKKFVGNSRAPSTFARIAQSASGSQSEMIWIFAVKGSVDKATTNSSIMITNYYDFHIRACWQSPVGGEIQRLGTIVRLYEPAQR